jgi:phospholipid/cholesterol/gamma-HCH transport system substrate-binding protein
MPKEPFLAFKVGLFVLAAIVGLTVVIFSISDTAFFEEGKTFHVVFSFANGMKKTAPVRIAGVDQGLVKDIVLFFDRADGKTKVDVTVQVKKETQIPQDSVFVINQLGLMGEKYLEVFPGQDTVNFITEGQTVIGKSPLAQEEISSYVMIVAQKVEQTVDGINTILRDEGNVAAVKNSLADVQSILTEIKTSSNNLSHMTTTIDEVVTAIKSGQGTVGKLLYDPALYNNLEGFTADLKANPWKLLYRPKK